MKLVDALRQRVADWRHERWMTRLHRELSRLIENNDKSAAQAWERYRSAHAQRSAAQVSRMERRKGL